MSDEVLHLNSITDVTPAMTGGIAVSGSHGGIYPASIASRAGLRGIVFNDAGGGLDNAGAAGIFALASVGLAAVCADCMTCLIGSADDMFENGLVSQVNAIATALGVGTGLPVKQAVRLLAKATTPVGRLSPVDEARRILPIGASGGTVLALDSASLVTPDDAGKIVITGSHGGLIGGDPARALKAAAKLAVFNDAGIGKQGIGTTRLPALNHRGVAAVTLSHTSCRIGDAGSAIATGRVSVVNDLALGMGAQVGEDLATFLERIVDEKAGESAQ